MPSIPRAESARRAAAGRRRAAPPAPEFRKLWPADRERLAGHLLRLDPGDRQMRFCGSLGDRALRDYCGRIDWSESTVLGCVLAGELRGVAQLVRARRAAPGQAELALSVERPYQDRGLGSELLRRALVIARNRYLSPVYMICLLENRKMQHIARKFDAGLVVHAGEVEGRLEPPWPSYLSFVEEAALDGQALFRALFATRA